MSTYAIVVASLYFVLAGLVPVLSVLLHYKHGLTYIKLYSHLFLYPLFFGWLSAFFIASTHPYITELLRQARQSALFWLGIALFTLVALALELGSKNIAPWEIKPSMLGTREADYFNSTPHDKAEKQNYQDTLVALVGKMGNWSFARYAYIVSFIVQTGTHFTVLWTSAVLVRYRVVKGPAVGPDFLESLKYTVLAFLVALLFLLMRFAFSRQKLEYYPSESLPAADVLIAGVYLLGCVFVAGCFWLWVGERISSLVSTLLAGGTSWLILKRPDLLVKVFGKDSTINSYFCILAAILLTLYIRLLVRF